VHLPELLDVAEQGDPGPQYWAAAPYLDEFDSLIAGGRVEDRLLLSRLVLTLAQ
jgi:hypothetical protein